MIGALTTKPRVGKHLSSAALQNAVADYVAKETAASEREAALYAAADEAVQEPGEFTRLRREGDAAASDKLAARHALAILRPQLDEAMRREEREAFQVELDALEKRTARRALTIERDYLRFAEAFAAIPRELVDDAAEWHRMAERARKLGVEMPGRCLEHRTAAPGRSRYSDIPILKAVVPAWDGGKRLFDGGETPIL